jgi:hypothetical protein
MITTISKYKFNMSYLILTMSLLLNLSNSCTKESLLTKDEWLVGEDKSTVIKEINGTGKDLNINLESVGFCEGASGIQLTVENKGNVIFSSNVEQFPYANKIQIPANANIKITTQVFGINNPTVACIRLGNVKCSISY